jgi:hypothetical protein
MSKRKKNTIIALNVRPLWELGKGHNEHRSGSGQHNNQPKRLRTRGAKNRQAVRDGW